MHIDNVNTRCVLEVDRNDAYWLLVIGMYACVVCPRHRADKWPFEFR